MSSGSSLSSLNAQSRVRSFGIDGNIIGGRACVAEEGWSDKEDAAAAAADDDYDDGGDGDGDADDGHGGMTLQRIRPIRLLGIP